MDILPDHEQKLLALLIAADPAVSPFHDDFAAGADAIDWAYFAQLVERHRVGALVQAGLRLSPHINAPTDLHKTLSAYQLENAKTYMRSVDAANRICADMNSAGIDCALLKGLGIAAGYYQEPAQREMIDIDLLVSSAHFEAAEHILQTHGFTMFYPDFPLDARRRQSFYRLHNAFAFIRSKDGLQLDLHWRTVQNPVMLPQIDRHWPQSIVRRQISGLTIPVLSTAPHFLYVMTHGAKHAWVRLKWLADVDRMVRGLDAAAIGEIAALTQRMNAERLVSAGLGLARDLLGTPLPDALAGSASDGKSTCLMQLEQAMIFGDLPGEQHNLRDWRHFADRIRHSLLLHRTPRYRREALLRELARPADLATIPVPPSGLWMLAIISPLLGLWRGFKRLIGG